MKEVASIVTCYCGSPMVLKESRFGQFYGCTNYPACDGVHGVHKETGKPMGVPAPKAVRMARMRAHDAFDRVWRAALSEYQGEGNLNPKKLTSLARSRCYAYVSAKLEMDPAITHISMMLEADCERVIQLCESLEYRTVRAWWKSTRAS